ncbi:uncharacterized protein MELLADRAFT_92329 [Melampsora larici-populina 98AG31]|uniref:Uncharacterized protein n=1 Tax=Melampsora larici-populina (strain 98AG31 / pathotype 3-4-7) TaxID=747676 RepID=F4R980_MELLP|nr:uncharacterized protein MELLADRAFT_92329 [Melampsora larici-populina 98AG31]EGG10937.1 hypothetical protein MELLADRAFT_92329 [Melampsora larici-populina 98AG31]
MPINTRSRKTTPPGAVNLRKLKRRKQSEAERDEAESQRRRDLETQTSNQTQSNTHSSNQPHNQSQSQQSPSDALELEEIDVHNYGHQKKFWPLQRIEEKLKAQTTDNKSRPPPLILAEAKAIHEAFQHSLHMLAMIGQVHLTTLKLHLGIVGGTRATNAWNRFLAFSKLAYKNPMPLRGAPDAGSVLTTRNQANRKEYDNLTDDEYAIFTSRIFHALGGYPDYSAISVEDHETAGDCEVLIPEVPTLSPEEEALYRPIYNKLVDSAKVAKDRARFKSPSPEKKERLSLRAFKKRVQQLHHDAALADFDYYAIGCSKTLGTGWCQEFTSLPEISTWMDERIKFQTIFPIYSQARPKIKEIEAAGTASNNTITNKFSRPPNKSDRESTELTSLLLAQLKALGVTLPTRGFPRGPDLPALFEKHKVDVKFVRHSESAMSISEFMLGFDGMKTLGRRHWLQDIKDMKFMMVKKDSPVTESWSVLGGEIQQAADGGNGVGPGPGGDGGGVGTGGGDGNTDGAGGGLGPGVDGEEATPGGGVGLGSDGGGVGTGGGVETGGNGGGVGTGGDGNGGDGETGNNCVHL